MVDKSLYREQLKQLGNISIEAIRYFGYDDIEITDGRIGNGLIVFYINRPIWDEDEPDLSTAINMQLNGWQVWFTGNRIAFSKILDTDGNMIDKGYVRELLSSFPLYIERTNMQKTHNGYNPVLRIHKG